MSSFTLWTDKELFQGNNCKTIVVKLLFGYKAEHD